MIDKEQEMEHGRYVADWTDFHGTEFIKKVQSVCVASVLSSYRRTKRAIQEPVYTRETAAGRRLEQYIART